MSQENHLVTEKRVTLKRKRPNPLFQEWLEELYEEAKLKGSKLESMLLEALTSLSKYPLPLESGLECAILKGFDRRLCAFLDKRLAVYRDVASPPKSPNADEKVSTCDVSSSGESDVVIENKGSQSSSGNARKRPNSGRKAYKPALKSGGYAILVALLEQYQENPANPRLTKDALITKAQKHSDESFIRPKPESFYTAWSNMTRLIKKELVVKTKGKKAEFSLTSQGVDLAELLLNESKNTPSINDIVFNNAPSATVVTDPVDYGTDNCVTLEDDVQNVNENTIELQAGRFDVILLIDKNETGGVSKKNDPTVSQFNKYPDLKHEYRSLKVGDFTWIARCKDKKDQELVLPYVVERKRMDDLGASIKDGRFHEQKFRLRKCGLKNVVYLVENYGSNKHVGLPLPSLMQALANTRVQDGFKVHITDSLTNTARFLTMMTKRLTIEFKDKDLKGVNNEPSRDMLMTYTYFNKSSAKSKVLTVTESFIKLLLQLKGMSVEKALAITNVYKTPRCLMKLYEEHEHASSGEGDILLANLKYGELGRNVGLTVSKSVYHLFSNKYLV